MIRSGIREFPASGVTVQRGEVLVPTQIGDNQGRLLSCAAAPLIAGSLLRKGRQVRLAAVPRCAGTDADPDVIVHIAYCPQDNGGTTAIAAITAPADKLAAAVARSAVDEWAAVSGRRMLVAAGSPWCRGALHAADSCRGAALEHAGTGRAVRLLGPLTLPLETVAELASLGATQIASVADAEAGDVVVFPAQGVSDDVRRSAADRGLTVIDATCPLVARAQATAAQVADRGQHLVLIGQPGATATGPISSQAAGHVTIVETAGGTAALQVSDGRRVSYMLQPGMPVEAASNVVSALRSRYPAATSTQPEGLCYAASDRAATIHAVAVGSDLIMVLGDSQSSDARQVGAMAREAGAKVQVIGATSDITPEMIASATTIALAESTSAPAALASQVIAAIGGLGQVSVARRQVSTELATPRR
jgi:4-hydroxy-3-methylbut-2-en-1-yl diphosphate reductase